ncbi:MAG: tetratricopeptide repeat protein, partial [Eubacteriales bacterium]|nr:tetratricopeptide repeat protein [Eubacteriales bacterium]
KEGNVPAMFDLGKMYFDRLLEEANDKKAEFLFRYALGGYTALEQAKESDFYEYQIGRLYGLKTSFQDYAEAKKWFELSAEKGNAYAMFALGNIHYYGNGTEVHYEKAFAYFRSSAEENCVHSYFKLGYMLRKGIGCEENIRESDVLFAKMIQYYEKKDIEKEDALNCYRLGQLFEKGWGTTKDISKAMEYYRAACKSNNANAEFALGRLCFMQGNDEEGEYYINLAVEHGNAYAGEWYEQWKDYWKSFYAHMGVSSALNLFCRLANIINDDAIQKIDGHNKTIVDSKERKELAKKKQRLGIKMG